jgi:hypothetical protein
MSKLRLLLLVSALSLVTAVSSTSAAPAKMMCVCTHLSYPVLCSDGNFYGNPCLAACAHATDCVPVEEK